MGIIALGIIALGIGQKAVSLSYAPCAMRHAPCAIPLMSARNMTAAICWSFRKA
jgi:hypothetical protein